MFLLDLLANPLLVHERDSWRGLYRDLLPRYEAQNRAMREYEAEVQGLRLRNARLEEELAKRVDQVEGLLEDLARRRGVGR